MVRKRPLRSMTEAVDTTAPIRPNIDEVPHHCQCEIAYAGDVILRRPSTFDELASAFEQIGGVVHQFAAPFKHVAAHFGDVLAGGLHGFSPG